MEPLWAAPSHEPTGAPEVTNRRLIRWTLSFLRPVRDCAFLACLCQALCIGAEILAVRQTAEVVNQIKEVQFKGHVQPVGFWNWLTGRGPEVVPLRSAILVLGAITLALYVLTYLRGVTNARFSLRVVSHIREVVYDKLQQVGFGFHDRNSTGTLISKSLNDLQNIGAFLNSAVILAMEIALVVFGYLILLLTRSPWVALLAVTPLPFWTWYSLRFNRKVRASLAAVMQAQDRDVSIITENVEGVHVVKGFSTQARETARYQQNCTTFYRRLMDQIRMFANFTSITRGIVTASNLVLFLAAGILIMKGRLAPGDLLMLGAAMGAILSRLQQVAEINEQYQSAMVSSRRVHELLTATPAVDQRPGAQALPPGPGAVRFEHVTFGYDPARPVLHDITFETPGGSVVAIVGPTGAGKTTLVNLIARFYDPQKGRILIDGTDIREARLDSLRTQVAYVFQETYLFSETISANIAYGRPELCDGPVEAAARSAQAHEFVERLPNGYETTLSERGASLSGGQRQRLAIARAILPNPRILVLDDATAALDSETESRIQRDMERVRDRRTTFVIAHRISTVKQADIVIVLEAGRITQMGTHEQLMAEDGHYREITAAQLRGDSTNGDTGAYPHGESGSETFPPWERCESR